MLVQFRKQVYIKFPGDYAVLRNTDTYRDSREDGALFTGIHLCHMLTHPHLQVCAAKTGAQGRLSSDDAGDQTVHGHHASAI
jgi:hypothetical protein